MTEASQVWQNALREYSYEVDLTRFADRANFPGWFAERMNGSREATKDFEDYFRERAHRHLEVWYEVVFWKMYSQRRRADKRTRDVVRRIQASKISAFDLWQRCCAYVSEPSQKRLELVARTLLSEKARVVAIAATFPAFIAPDRFPMVDTRVAKWARACSSRHNLADPMGPQLICPEYPDNGSTVLTLSDWPFIESWIQWCRHTAMKLKHAAGFEWRVRDVEMAVFRAWGDKGERGRKRVAKDQCLIHLPELEPLPQAILKAETPMDALRQVEDLLPALTRAEKAQLLRRVVQDLDDAFPGIESSPGVCGGEPCIIRTRIPVWVLEQARRLGASEEELLRSYPALRAEDLANAWAYVRSHRLEIEEQIRENESA